MLMLAIAMLVILVVAGLVVTYVAFPHRGEEIPGAPWLGDAMTKANEKLPKLQDGDLDAPEEHGEGYGRAS
jgi:hypothetical protein